MEGQYISAELIIAIVTAVTSLVGSLGGILISNKLTLYRIEQLEKKVDKHNDVIKRTYEVETAIGYIKDDITELKGRE